MNTTLQLRIDKNTKNSAKKIFDKLGLDLSSAVKIFLRQVIVDEKIPFEIRTENGYTAKYEAGLLRDIKKGKLSKKFTNTEDLINDL